MTPKRQVLLDDKRYNCIAKKRGGMGLVWLLERPADEGYDSFYRPRLAVKTFDFMKDETAVERELNNWIGLEHVRIAQLLKISRLNYRIAAVMPLYSGSLDELLSEIGAFSVREVADVLLQVAVALEYAYRGFRLLHLDLKPGNLLIDTHRPLAVKLTDWGVSRLSRSPSNQSAFHLQPGQQIGATAELTSYVGGTPLFMAPERFTEAWKLEPIADIYSLGMLAVVLATGVLPFRGGQTDPLMEVATGAYYENAARVLANYPRRFTEFCLKSLHPLASHRIQDHKDVIRMLRKIK